MTGIKRLMIALSATVAVLSASAQPVDSLPGETKAPARFSRKVSVGPSPAQPVDSLPGKTKAPERFSRKVSVAPSSAQPVDSLPGETKAPEHFSRNIEQIAFVPKGQWIGGVSVSYSQSNQDKYQFLIIENISGDTYTFKVSPMLMFAFKNNLAAGGRFAYSRSRTRLKSADIVLDSETGYDMENLYSINHSYTGTAAFRQYMSLGGTTRFGFFNEVQLQLGGGQSKLCNGAGQDLTGTYSTNFSLDVGLAPGLIVFLNNYSAIEVNVGVLGFNYTKNNMVTDQIYYAKMRHSSANFKINLFSITFGVAFYI